MSEIRLTMKQAIKAKCLDCCCWQINEVRLCRVTKCPLWRYRTGKEVRDELYKPRKAPTGGYQFKKKIVE